MLRQSRAEDVGGRGVVDEPTLLEFGENVHGAMLSRPRPTAPNLHTTYCGGMAKPEPTLHEAMLIQAEACGNLGSPMHREVLLALAEDLALGGITADLTDGLDLRPGRDAVPLRIIGAVHREVLAGRAPDLARHFPSVGGTPGPTLVADYLETLHTHREAVVDGLGRTVQTNEVGRTTMLVTGLSHIARTNGVDAVHLREVGASCGLNQLVDKFFFDTGSSVAGDPHSSVRFETDAWGTPPVDIGRCPSIVSRGGCDVAPLDAHDPEDRLTLLSFVWPDQDRRFVRLRNALDIAAVDPDYRPPVAADAAEWIDEELRGIPTDEPVVVFHSIVWQYFSQSTKDDFRAVLRRHAGRRPAALSWLRMEPAGPVADLRVTSWTMGRPTEQDRQLALSSYHGIGTHMVTHPRESA